MNEEMSITLFHENDNGIITKVWIYLEDICDDGVLSFNVDYEVTYPSGMSHNGNAMYPVDRMVKAYDFVGSEELFSHYEQLFKGDKSAFKKIIHDAATKGIQLSVDESECW